MASGFVGDLAERSAAQVGRKADSALQKLIKKRRRKLCKRALAVGLPSTRRSPGTSRHGCYNTSSNGRNALIPRCGTPVRELARSAAL